MLLRDTYTQRHEVRFLTDDICLDYRIRLTKGLHCECKTENFLWIFICLKIKRYLHIHGPEHIDGIHQARKACNLPTNPAQIKPKIAISESTTDHNKSTIPLVNFITPYPKWSIRVDYYVFSII